jgi:hypothetical protein
MRMRAKFVLVFVATVLMVAGPIVSQAKYVDAAPSVSVEQGSIQQISCATGSNCVGVGQIENGSGWHPFIFETDSNGKSHVVPLTGPVNVTQRVSGVSTGTNVDIDAVSCASSVDCVAGGYFTDANGVPQAFLVEESHGMWKRSQVVASNLNVDSAGSHSTTGPSFVGVTSVSCPRAGDCAVVGNYVDGVGNHLAFLVLEKHKVWGKAKEIGASLDGGSGAQLTVVSCARASNCVAGGTFDDPNGASQAFLVEESSGVWGKAFKVGQRSDAGMSSSINSISCSKNGDCVAGGQEGDKVGKQQAFAVEEVDGVWHHATEVVNKLNAGGIAAVTSVACAEVGSCVAGGYFETSNGYQQAFIVSQNGGVWSKGTSVANQLNVEGRATINSVSCFKVGFCEGGGQYQNRNGGQQAFVVGESHGAWQTATEVAGNLNQGGLASVSSVECTKKNACVAAGEYSPPQGNFKGFVLTGLQ